MAFDLCTMLSPFNALTGTRPALPVSGIGRDLIENGAEIRLDGAEARLIVADQIHFVHRYQDMAHPQQRSDVRVPPRLDQHSLAGVDQHYRRVGRRGARRHVARVLLVPRRVRDDELASRRGKIPIGNIDGDALLALGAKPVGQQREIDLARRGGSLPSMERTWSS